MIQESIKFIGISNTVVLIRGNDIRAGTQKRKKGTGFGLSPYDAVCFQLELQANSELNVSALVRRGGASGG